MITNTYSNKEGHIVEFTYKMYVVQLVTKLDGVHIFRLYSSKGMYQEEVPYFLTVDQCIALVKVWEEDN